MYIIVNTLYKGDNKDDDDDREEEEEEKNNITCSTNCKYRTAATLCTLERSFLFMYIIVNTLYKGDNKDDDKNNL